MSLYQGAVAQISANQGFDLGGHIADMAAETARRKAEAAAVAASRQVASVSSSSSLPLVLGVVGLLAVGVTLGRRKG